jgi:hypothetical protein
MGSSRRALTDNCDKICSKTSFAASRIAPVRAVVRLAGAPENCGDLCNANGGMIGGFGDDFVGVSFGDDISRLLVAVGGLKGSLSDKLTGEPQPVFAVTGRCRMDRGMDGKLCMSWARVVSGVRSREREDIGVAAASTTETPPHTSRDVCAGDKRQG